MSAPDAEELRYWRSEHAASLYALGVLRGDSWMMSEGYLAAVQQDGSASVRAVEMYSRAIETIKNHLPDEARQAMISAVQSQLTDITRRMIDNLPSDNDISDCWDPQLTYMNEPLRKICDGD